MKKFLSILLAVMMVLSTVSFAAPSLAGTADVAVEVPVAVVPEVEETAAELAAEAGDESTYGKLIINVDFENFEVGSTMTDYQYLDTILEAEDYDPAFTATYWVNWEVGANEIVEENGNKYIRGGQGYAQVRMENQKYGRGAPDGIYTFVVDAIDFGSVERVVSTATQDNYVQGEKVNSGIAAKKHNEWSGKLGEWETLAAEWDGASNNMTWYFTNDAKTDVGFDNIKVYYRPRNVKLTIAGEEYEVSTSEPVTVASLAANVKAPTGYVLSGFSLTEGGALISDQYFLEDTTLYPTFKKDSSIHPEFGKAVYIIDYEKEGIAPGHGITDASTYVTALTDTYNKAFPLNNSFVYLNFATSSAVASEGDNSFLRTVSKDGYTSYLYLSKWSQDWPEGYYTFSTDVRLGSVVNSRTVQHNNDASIVTWVEQPNLNLVNEWQNVQYQFIGKGSDLTTSFLCFNGAATIGANIDYDNVALYYKPYTADVTLIVNGKEYVVEDIATSGVSAASILEKAGVSIPYGKKPVLSETFGGESVGNVINLVMDSTYYVSFVADDSIHPVYGKRMFLVDFEKFDEGAILKDTTDNKAVSYYTDDYDGDFANATINWEVGANTVVEEDGNKFIKGQQGWAQVRINNANYASFPAGKYTMSLRTKNYGTETKYLSSKDQDGGTMAKWLTGPVAGTINSFTVEGNGDWYTAVSQLDMATKDFTIYYTAPMTTDVAFDDVALYYLPDSVELTIVNGDETVTKTVSNGVSAEELLADVAAPFGYKVALSTTPDAADAISGPLSLVSNTTLYVVTVPDETVSFDYGKAILIIDFEREDMQGWDGNSQEINNSVANSGAQVFQSATYYDPMFQSKNYRIRFVINESPVTDQGTVADEKGNHYTTGTNTSRWPQVVSTNWGNVQAQPGTYTYVFDVKVEDSTETPSMTHNAFHDGTGVVLDSYNYVDGKWDTVAIQVTMNEAGNLPKGTWGNFNFSANNVAKISFDNTKIYYKPFTATVNVMANGEVVKTVSNVDTTAGVLASELVSGVKISGYDVTGVKLGTTVYGLDEKVVPPCDCAVELVLEEKQTAAAAPETSEERNIRVDDPSGIRFKASLKKADDESITDYGWIITRADLLDAAGISGEAFTMEAGVKYVSGYGRKNSADLKSFYAEDDDYNWFTAVLFFSENEADGLPSAEKLAGKLVARPFVKIDGEEIYGDASAPTSIYDVAVAAWENAEFWDNLTEDEQFKLDDIMIKVEDAGLGA